ncbi:MAG: hypothetical protein ACTHU0_37375 [Kofleriaceae bacterium]
MSDYRMARPMITWHPGGSPTILYIGYPLDNVVAGPEPRAGFEVAQAPSGVEDAWDAGTDYVLEGDVRWIPPNDTATPLATGWDNPSSGFAAFLTYARQKNVIYFYPDQNDLLTYIACYLVEPLGAAGEREPDGTRHVRIKLRNSTTPFAGY